MIKNCISWFMVGTHTLTISTSFGRLAVVGQNPGHKNPERISLICCAVTRTSAAGRNTGINVGYATAVLMFIAMLSALTFAGIPFQPEVTFCKVQVPQTIPLSS